MNEGALHELPEGWGWTRLVELAVPNKNSIKRGPFGSAIKKSFFVQKGYKVYEQQNAIYDNSKLGNYYIDEEKYNELIDFVVNPGDFIISCSGTIGKITQIPKNAEKGVINQALLKIAIDQRLIFPEYFLYIFRSEIFQKKVLKETRGSTMKNIASVEDLKQIQIALPPLSEQRAIISKIEQFFSNLDDGIKNFKKAQAQLKRYRQSVLKAACEGKLVPTEAELARMEGREYEAADVLLARILKERREKLEKGAKYKEPVAPDTSGLHELPEGWCWANVEQVGDINEQAVLTGPFGSNLGREDFKDSGVPVLTIGCLTQQGLSLEKAFYISDNKASELERYKVKSKDILFSRMATVGRADLVSTQFEGAIINYHLMRLRLAAIAIDPIYFISYVRGSKTVVEYVKEVNHGATRDGINTGQLLSLPIALPPLAEQHRIVAEVERRLSICDKMEAIITESLQKAESLRQSILKKAFEGKLLNKKELEEARNAPDWEPAEKLLERIKAEKNNIKTRNKDEKR